MTAPAPDYGPISHAVRCLAGVDNYASTWDGQGFNKFDADFGQSAASREVGHWSPRMAFAVHKMLRKYRKQLAGFGIDYDALPVPPPPESAEGKAAAKKHHDAQVGGKKRTVTLEEGQIVLRFPYDPRVVEAVRQMPSRRWHAETKTWRLPLLQSTVEQVNALVKAWDFEVSGDVQAELDAFVAEVEELIEASEATDADITVEGLVGDLMPFQRAGVAYALRRRKVLIADEMGLGKTVQALATLQAADAFPAVVVCPASLKLNWRNEAQKWLPHRSVQVVSGRGGDLFGADITIINYDILAAWEDTLVAHKPVGLVFDESHYMKNRRAKRTKAAKAIAKRVGSPYILQLTGTPVLNRPAEIITLLEILGALRDLGGYQGFLMRYCAGTAWDPTAGGRNLTELNERLRTTCYIRRKKADVLKELPAKRRSNMILPMDKATRREYDRAADELLQYVYERAAAKAALAQAASLDLLDAEEAERLQDREGQEAKDKAERAEVLVRIATLKRLAVRGKMEAAFEWIDSFLDTGEKLVLFAWHTEVVEEVAKRYGAAKITGQTQVADRQAAVERFQNDPECKVIVGNIMAMGVGLTLTAASNVAFLELPWRPADLDQAEDRCHRIGQQESVTAWYLLAEDSIDADIYGLIEQKRTMVNAATDGTEPDEKAEVKVSELLAALRRRRED